MSTGVGPHGEYGMFPQRREVFGEWCSGSCVGSGAEALQRAAECGADELVEGVRTAETGAVDLEGDSAALDREVVSAWPRKTGVRGSELSRC